LRSTSKNILGKAMKILRTIPYAVFSLSLVIGIAQAAPSELKMFGAAAPFTIDKLPVSRLRSRLEGLPLPAQKRAMKWLHQFTFPAADIEFLEVDQQGGVFYRDTVLPEEISQSELEGNPSLEGIVPTDVFKLHSKPGAAKVVYVNFKGYIITGTAWNSAGNSYQAKPFDKDSNPDSFSNAERIDIAEIWHRIAEDYAPFNVDVTTEMPASFGPTTGHILITSTVDANGQVMPSSGGGGVAYVNVWGRSNYEYYQPALVYFNHLASAAPYIAEAASHELGHNLGLSHDGTSAVGYYQGNGSGLTSWAPIMGVGYYTNITQWSKGEYADANNPQDDLAIIKGKVAYRTDDHSNTFDPATPLLVDVNGNLASSNPEIDPLNQRPDNKGIIEVRTDVDTFYFDTGAGDINLTINPAWDAFTRGSHRGANLDIQATLYDALGREIVTDPINDTNVVINEYLPAGRYYLAISGTGNANSPYSDYGSLGQYYISGMVVATSEDITPPNPDAMTWAETPLAMSRSSITMTATMATDDFGAVEYQFICASGGLNCVSSAWQTAMNYSITGLDAGTAYSYQVKARDSSANETALSVSASAVTDANIAPQSVDDAEVVDANTATAIDVLANDTDADGDTLQISSISTSPVHGDVVINNNQVVYTSDIAYSGPDSFSYSVSDGFGGISSSIVTVDVMQVNLAPTAVTDTVEVLIGGSVVVNVLFNDSDPEGAALSVISVTNGSKGTTTINTDGTISYVAGSRRGGDSFSYNITDGELSATAVVNISIVRKLSSGGGDTGSTKCHPKRGC